MELVKASAIMATKLLTLRPELDIYDAVDALLKRKFSGAPVVDADGKLVGVLSEKDCLRLLANGTLYGLPAGTVADFMTSKVHTVDAATDLLSLAGLFLHKPYRRLPVVDADGNLVGQVSRRDVLRAIQKMHDTESPYPDYVRPA